MFKSAYSILIAASVALMVFAFVPEADAQRGGRGGRNQSDELTLLGNEKVQEELELVDDQIEEIKELGDEMRNAMREMFSGMRERSSGASAEERSEMWAEMREEMKTQAADIKPKINSVLLPAQAKRLAEIKMQTTIRQSGGLTSERGSQALKEQLDISDDQLAAMKEKATEVRESFTKKVAKLRKEAEMEVLSVLDTEQREKYEELMGESYDVDSLFQRGGNRGGGNRGGNRGGGNRGGGDQNGDSSEAN